jgi:hypothetical protein
MTYGKIPALERMEAISRAISQAGTIPALERMDAITRAVSQAGTIPALERMDAITRAVSQAGTIPALERMDAITRAVSQAGTIPALERMDAITRAVPGTAVLPALELATAWLDEVRLDSFAWTAHIDGLLSQFGEASAFADVIDLDDFESSFATDVEPAEAEVAEWLVRFLVYYYAAFTAVLVASTVQSHAALKSAVEWMMLVSLVYGVIVKKFKPC